MERPGTAQCHTLQAGTSPNSSLPTSARNVDDFDFNVEQHNAHLEVFNPENDSNSVPNIPILTVPADIYSDNHDSLEEAPDGATVAVRTRSTLADIAANPHHLEMTEMRSLIISSASVDST